jgi:hypothetical protein
VWGFKPSWVTSSKSNIYKVLPKFNKKIFIILLTNNAKDYFGGMNSHRTVLSARAYEQISLDSTIIREDLREKISFYRHQRMPSAPSERKSIIAGIKKQSRSPESKQNSKEEDSRRYGSPKRNLKLNLSKNSTNILESMDFSSIEEEHKIPSKKNITMPRLKNNISNQENVSDEEDDSKLNQQNMQVVVARRMKKLFTAMPAAPKQGSSILRIRNDIKKSVDLYSLYKNLKDRKIYTLSPRSEKMNVKLCDMFLNKRPDKSKIDESKIKLFIRQLIIYRSKILRGFERNKANKVIKSLF